MAAEETGGTTGVLFDAENEVFTFDGAVEIEDDETAAEDDVEIDTEDGTLVDTEGD